MKAMLVGWDNPLTTVLTERFGSVIPGPLVGELTVVWSVTELSLASESLSVATTDALFVKVPAACGTTTMLIIANASLAIAPNVQVTVVVPEQFPWVGVADTKLIPEGRLSVTMRLVAGDGPLFSTVRRYVRFA